MGRRRRRGSCRSSGICRGFAGDQRLLRWDAPPARRRPRRARAGATAPARDPSAPGRARHQARAHPVPDQQRRWGRPVNSYHHQAVRAADLAPGLVANAWSSSPAGDLVEGLEAADGRFVFGLQCHPERQESTPPAFERLFSVFVDAARGPADRR